MTKPYLGSNLLLDVDKLVESRLLIQANSGGGKSWAIRRICEQTYVKVPHIIIDVEGEFHTLREKFDYVLANQKDGDTRADLKSAPLLARRLLELNVSAIVDIYELGAKRAKFVQLFLESLVNAPRDLWHPLLVVVDEANMFCPEGTPNDASAAVIDLMTRGRKRGFAGILATQRISSLNKAAAAECNNKLIGRSALDIDMKRAASELGFTSKDEMQALRKLAPGTFHVFGPAFTDVVTEVKIGPVETTHPKAGARALPPTPPRASIKKILAQLADLPQEAEEEAKTLNELRAQVKQLKTDLSKTNAALAKAPTAKVETKIVEKPIINAAQAKALAKVVDKYFTSATKLAKLNAALSEQLQEHTTVETLISTHVRDLTKTVEQAVSAPPALEPFPRTTATPPTRAPRVTTTSGDTSLSKAELRILEACAWAHAIGLTAPATEVVAFLAGYTVNGHFTNMRGKLHTAGFVDYPGPGTLRLTEAGEAAAPEVTRPLTTEELHRAVFERLDSAQGRLLRPLIDAYPETLSDEELAQKAGYTVNGHFTNMRGRLRTMGLITYPSPRQVRAADLLFPTD